jgi:hypothetical protein
MLNEARIGLLLLSALTANIAPACGRAFKRAEPTDGAVSRVAAPRPPASSIGPVGRYFPLLPSAISSQSSSSSTSWKASSPISSLSRMARTA